MSAIDLTTRRAFLHRGLTLIGAAATVPTFIERTAWAAGPAEGQRIGARPGVPEDHVLVILQLAGGNDGLNTVVPVGSDAYYRNRPRLGIDKKAALRLDDAFSLHPALTGLKSLYDDGVLGIVHGVGYPNPNRSHFKSTDIWETASPEGRYYTGWVGRYFDHTCQGQDPPNPQFGIAVRKEAPLAMRGQRFMPVSFERPESLTWNGDRRGPAQPPPRNQRGNARNRRRVGPDRGGDMPADGSLRENFEELNQPAAGESKPLTELAYLQRTAMDARLSAADIQSAAGGQAPVPYPQNPLAGPLRTVARMINSKLPTRIYYVTQGGYDTHSGQQNRHQQLLTQLGDSLKAFVADLKATGQFGRVTIMTFSEFGRRVAENASGGTDHGAAAPLFVLGPKVKPGLHGQPCDLEDLDRGDLKFTTDFRGVYAAMLTDWLGTDAKAILGPGHAPMPILSPRG